MDIIELLNYAVKKGASDLHLSAKMPPLVRIDGDLQNIPETSEISNDELKKMLKEVLQTKDFERLEHEYELDLAVAIPEVSRFRVNVFYQLDGLAVAFRVIPEHIMTLEELGMLDVLKRLSELENGLVLLTGPTGCGKSTTLAAMIDYINERRPCHILTMEDPVEFVHKSKKALIQQREIHHQTESFENALRAALREDPDVILVGEMRDIETVRLALTAAETGHLVLATLHTSSAPKTVNRIIDIFPAGEKMLIRTLLAESLQAVVAQKLLKKRNGGRLAVHEVMVCTPAIRNLIREDKVEQMMSLIQAGQKYGMVTLDASLKEVRQQGLLMEDI